MFDFRGEADDPPPSPSPRKRIAAVSGSFLAMIALTVIAMAAAGFFLIWLIRAVQN